jgi:hypothetical protein
MLSSYLAQSGYEYAQLVNMYIYIFKICVKNLKI